MRDQIFLLSTMESHYVKKLDNICYWDDIDILFNTQYVQRSIANENYHKTNSTANITKSEMQS